MRHHPRTNRCGPPGHGSSSPARGRFGERLSAFVRSTLPTVVMVAVGIAALGFTAWQAWDTAAFLHRASRTTGTIIDPSAHPRIRFTAADGREVTFVQNGFVSLPLGAEVPVAYDPADPAGTARADTVWTTWVAALWGLPMGLGFTLLPLFGYRAYWRGGRW